MNPALRSEDIEAIHRTAGGQLEIYKKKKKGEIVGGVPCKGKKKAGVW